MPRSIFGWTRCSNFSVSLILPNDIPLKRITVLRVPRSLGIALQILIKIGEKARMRISRNGP